MYSRSTRPLAGQAIVEFSLTVVLLFALILGVLDVGVGVVATQSLASAVREAARRGAILYPESGWETAAADAGRAAAFGIDLSRLALSVRTQADGGDTFVAVTGTYPFRPVAPYLTIGLSEVVLQSSSRMLVP